MMLRCPAHATLASTNARTSGSSFSGVAGWTRGAVFCSREIRAGPHHVVAPSLKHLYDRLRKVLVGEEPHLRWNRERFVFVGEITGVSETGEDVLSREAQVVAEDFVFRLAGCQELQDELDGKTRPADHWLARHDLTVNHDALRRRHKHSLPCP